jgi:methylenetetrahydrofolate dehydrogenase (NADP+) / methenyltetrahydrofolate cyclohydrolase
MIINGKELADRILLRLKSQVTQLKIQNIHPTMTIIQIGDDIGSTSYIKQKQKAADYIGIKVNHVHLSETTTEKQLIDEIIQSNQDQKIQGIIIQRPVPQHLNQPKILNLTSPYKDVDGFVPGSEFIVPVAKAVGEILEEIYKRSYSIDINISDNSKFYLHWLKTKHICIIGRGDTAGKPIANYLNKLDCTTSIIHKSTSNRENIINQADVIISCVGKGYIIDPSTLKSNVILISVGIWRDKLGKLHGDYDEAKIDQIAAFYTPTPGGVGPLNVACLMTNLVAAAHH